MQQALWLQKFVEIYTELGTKDFQVLNLIYDPDVEFIDPMHRILGATCLIHYFDRLYTNVESCRFVIDHIIESDNEAALYWTMTYQHRKLNGGREITVAGHSHLKATDGLVVYHRDYFDAGAMVYEGIPLLGSMIRMIKKRSGDV